MKILNTKALMNTQDLRRAGTNQNARRAAARSALALFVQPNPVLTFLICLGWMSLAGSATGQPTNYSDEAAVASYVKGLLYWPDAVDKNSAAFRYKHLLYGEEAGKIRARVETMSSLYTGTDRTNSGTAEEYLRRGLTNNPASPVLGPLLLDIYYDRTVAESILARQAFANADFVRFAQTSAPPAWVISAEITAYDQAQRSNRLALATYLTLLTNSFGVADANGAPLGYRLFQQWAPTRGLAPATYTNNSGNSIPVTDTGPFFSGYKDLVLLYDLLRDYGRAAKERARLHLCRGDSTDRTNALSLITESERFLYLHAELLRGIFPGCEPVAGEASGLAEAIAGCAQSLADLGTLRQVVAGNRNVLGFEPDFLMLVEKFTGGVTYYDSYDSLREHLRPSNAEGPLAVAKAEWLAASAAYGSYRGYQDQLAYQFAQLTGPAEERLFQIVGAYPDDPEYATPQDNIGSELYQQLTSIESAKLRIHRNQVELNNLKQEIEIELWRAGAVSSTYITYGNQRASITEKIGHINATQAAANALADAANADSWWGGGAQVVNAAVQAGAEEWKGQLEAEKERQAAMEQAEIDGIESKARVKSLLLGMNTLAVDSQEAALLLKQELGRMMALLREKEDLERTLAESPESLAGRYFADPAHRLRCQVEMLRANQSFEEAQKWMFFMTRALEYKWNQPFTNYPPDSRIWSSASVFKLRNASELEDLWRAMNNYEQVIATTVQVGTNRFDWFSVRKDFLGFQDGRSYNDPLTGQILDPVSAFRTNLLRRLVPTANGEYCVIEFDTVRQIPGGFFFVGPTFTTNQPPTVDDPGRSLDKINYLKIRLVGSAMTYTNPLAGRLSYGGTSYLRNLRAGEFDSARPDRLRREMTAYSTRYWFNLGYGWEFIDRQKISDAYMERNPTHNPEIPPGTAEISEFKERSVAATGWKLEIPTIALGQRVLYLQELDDIVIYFQHRSAQRF